MADLTHSQRLQPSLLDRLTDDDRGNTRESREQRVMTVDQLRAFVLRDLAWLLNAEHYQPKDELDDYPEVQHSVLNFGVPSLAGAKLAGASVPELEHHVREAILMFEPRLLPDSLEVHAIVDDFAMDANALTFEIKCDLWAQPIPIGLFVRTEVDLGSGDTHVAEGRLTN
jgi:type VI secretion system protein ImpF